MRKINKSNINKIKRHFLENWILITGSLGLLILGFIIIWVSTLKLPDFKSFTERKIESSTKIYDRTGKVLLYDVHQNMKRTIIPYEAMGTNIKNATVAIEDSDFYKHKGIRISSIIRGTIWAKITGKKIQGGSTITQQLIKNTLLTPEVSIKRKIKEWILAIKLEKIMSKEEILALYLNEAPYGGNVYGVEEASKIFFGKEPIDLTLAESAYLAAIPNAPTLYSPYGKNKDKLENRKNLVLKRMLDINFIDQNQYDTATKENVQFLPQSPQNIGAPHFVFFIKDYLTQRYGENTLEEGGLSVTTTIDYDLQKKAEEIVKRKALENEKSWDGKNAAAVVIDPKTGQILAMVGSRDYFDKNIDGNYNVATAERQPGSSFKPIVYALALKKGYTEDAVLFDVRTEFNSSCSPTGTQEKTSGGNDCYHPDNYDGGFRGPMTLRNALAQSINVIAVKLLYLVGYKDAVKFAHDLGITTLNEPDRYGLTLVIGGGETTLLDMTSVYGVFANSGTRNPYTGILSVKDADGNTLEEYTDKSYSVLDSNIANNISSILSDNNARTPTFGANSPLVVPGYDVAVKTGTTNSNKDAWTIGYTPSVVVGVWVGNNENTPMKKGGSALAGPIWNEIITNALENSPNENFGSYSKADYNTPPILRGFWMGNETFRLDSVSNKLATEFTPNENIIENSITNVHTILYWIDKNNPLSAKDGGYTDDPLYNNWEYGISNWWINNQYKYKRYTKNDIPKSYDNIHTQNSLPTFNIDGIEGKYFNLNDEVNYSIKSSSIYGLKKIDIFVNKTYITSIKNPELTTNQTLNLNQISDITNQNTLRVIGVDNIGNKNEKTSTFYIND